jgi:hypothetical protein
MDCDTLQAARIGAGAAILGGIVAGVLSGAYQHFRDWYTRPRLKLEFDANSDKFEAAWTSGGSFDGVLIRVSLRNQGQTVAQNCRVFVTSLTSRHPSGSTPTTFTGSRQIAWAGWDFEPRSVQNGIVFYLDLARFSKETSGWQFTFKETRAKDEELKKYTGTYRFRLAAVADNCAPNYFDVDVDYNGNWNNLRAWTPSK